jgi:hypothetical protein
MMAGHVGDGRRLLTVIDNLKLTLILIFSVASILLDYILDNTNHYVRDLIYIADRRALQ